MTYREPLISPSGVLSAVVLDLLSDKQWRRLAVWSLDRELTVRDLLHQFRPMAEQCGDCSHEIRLVGELPHCGLFGSLEPDGSTHT